MTNEDIAVSERGVFHVTTCDLCVGDTEWAYALRHVANINAHWARRQDEQPAMFNGAIYLAYEHAFEGQRFHARLLQTDFKSYLFWREHGFSSSGVRDAFGSAIIRSAEGHVMLGVQTPGNINAGMAYVPGGFIDRRDVAAGGTVDIESSIARELFEETGLAVAGMTRVPGFLITVSGAQISLAIEWRSTLGSEALSERIMQHLTSEASPELATVVTIKNAGDVDRHAIPTYTQVLLRHLFAGS